MKQTITAAMIAAGLMMVGEQASAACANPVITTATGTFAADILDQVEQYRESLGQLNANDPGSIGNGRRQINWDAAPDAVSAPNAFAGNFFNADFNPRARGVEFTSPGGQFQLSATDASGAGILFSNINATYDDDQFRVFSEERLFTPIGSNIVTMRYFVPGSDVPAISRGLGVVFTDVELENTTSMEFFDESDNSVGVFNVPPSPSGLSFLGVTYDDSCVSKVRIVNGNTSVGPDESEGIDVVAMDDFIFGEPIANPNPAPSAVCANPNVTTASGNLADDIINQVEQFRGVLGALNANEPGSEENGRRQINWDAAPDGVSAPNAFAGDFFNADFNPRARGVEFTSPGDGFQLSATDASGAGVLFSNINAAYDNDQFRAFSEERLFTPIGSNVVTMRYFVAGTDIPAVSRGLGVVFTDVDLENTTSMEFFDDSDNSIGVFNVPPSPSGLSFVGVAYDNPCVSRVRIVNGNTAVGPDESGNTDVVVMDDFIFGEPVANANPPPFEMNIGLGGSWFEATTAGQGFLIDVSTVGNPFIFVTWFTYEPTGELVWFTAGGPFTDNSATLDILENSNGAFNAPTQVTLTNVGTMNIRFANCTTGNIDFDIPERGLDGSIPISRIVTDQICQAIRDGDLIIPTTAQQ